MRPEISNSGDSEGQGAQAAAAGRERAEPRSGHAKSLARLLTPDRVRSRVAASSRKRALEHACEILAGCEALNARQVLDALLARERLGSTALGDGAAVPHCRLKDCTAPSGVLLTLEHPIDYDAPDDDPVDLMFVLVVPDDANDEHLQLLSGLASLFIDADNRTALRNARDHLTLFETMQRLVAGAPADAPGATP